MNLLKNSVCSTTLLLALLISGCGSDRNPLDYFNFDGKNSTDAKTYIQLNLTPSTRATDEDAISLVNLYIFDADNVFEKKISDISVSSSNLTLALDVTTGAKTIYAVTANDIFGSEDLSELSLSDFGLKLFDTTLSSLINDNGFVMAGMGSISDLQLSNSPANIPSGNKLDIDLYRLVAKVNVPFSDATILSELGFSNVSEMSYKVCQTMTKMQLNPKEGSYISSSDADNDGTYDLYDSNYSADFTRVSMNSTSTQYMPENLVNNPTSGNTTFLCLRLKATPEKLYYLDNYGSIQETKTIYSTVSGENVVSGETFYAIGIYNDENNLIDFVKLTDDVNKLMCFRTKEAAQGYINGDFSGYSVGKPVDLPTGYSYNPIEYTTSYIYYRINISDGSGDNKKYRVLRNTSYRLKLSSLTTLGANSVSELFPADADSELDTSETGATFSDGTFVVKDWTEVDL